MSPEARTMDNTPVFAKNCNDYLDAVNECTMHKGNTQKIHQFIYII